MHSDWLCHFAQDREVDLAGEQQVAPPTGDVHLNDWCANSRSSLLLTAEWIQK